MLNADVRMYNMNLSLVLQSLDQEVSQGEPMQSKSMSVDVVEVADRMAYVLKYVDSLSKVAVAYAYWAKCAAFSRARV